MMFDTFFVGRKLWSTWWYIIGVSILTGLLAIVNNILLYRLGNMVGMILSAILVSMIFYSATWKKRVMVPLLTWVLFAALEMIVLNLMIILLNTTVNVVINTPDLLVLGIIASKTIGLAFCYGMRVRSHVGLFELGRSYWILFVFLFTSSAMASFLIFWMLRELNRPQYHLIAAISIISLYTSTFLVLYLYERSMRQSQIIHNQERLKQQMYSQIKHMDEMILSQNKIKAMRHDMNSHLIALKRYFDRGDISDGKKYISRLIDQFQNTTFIVNTGNNALDAIVSAKRSLAENKGIKFQTKIQIQEKVFMDPADISIIFGNALDNAIEACERLHNNKEKRIELVLQQDANTLFCRITNTAVEKAEHVSGTSKADKINHGFGLSNIRKALEKYDSTVSIENCDGMFHLKFFIFY